MSKVFKDFFSNFVVFFLAKLPDPSNKYNLEFVCLYYSNFDIPEVFHSKSTSEEKVFKIMKKLPGKFLKDGAEIYLSLLVKFATCSSLVEYFLMLPKFQNSNYFQERQKSRPI